MRSSTSNSDVPGGAAALVADDQQSDYWRRSTPPRAWATLALIAALITAGLVGAWEMYWRTQWHVAGDFKDSRGLWADQRRRATGEATVIIGSSRALFGLDMNVWEEAGHGRPIQLALPGTSPRMFLTDFAEDESFRGLLIIDVMSPAFFGRRGGRNEDVLPYYNEIVPAMTIIAGMVTAHWLLRTHSIERLMERTPQWALATAWSLMLFGLVISQGSDSAFIYFQF